MGGRIDDETTARQSADSALGEKIGDLTSLDTTDKTDLVSAINEVNAKTPMINITWSVLKALRDDGNLVKGMQYRITDYVTTTVQADTQSAGHAFDVIVRADSASVLNENAFAIQHEEDTYFANSKLSAWKLKYCLDNDTERFNWADTTNGKGVIYQLVDEFDNDLPYDFKNIQFKRWGVEGYLVNESKWALSVGVLNSLISSVPALRWGLPVYESAENAIDDNGNQWWLDVTSAYTLQNSAMGQWKIDDEYDLFVMSNDSSKWFYTFSGFTSDSAAVTDSSLSGRVYKNKFGSRLVSNKLALGNNVFIGNNFYYNTVGNNFYYNTVGNDFYYNTVGNGFNSNTVGNGFSFNTVGNGFSFNTVGNGFYYNTVGNGFNYNTVGNDFYSNTVGNYYRWNHIEDGCKNLNFSTNGTQSSYVQKYRVLAGTAPSSAQTVSLTAGNAIPYNVKQTGANTISVEAA